MVALAVAIEVICEWKKEKSIRESVKKYAGVLLVAGLMIEIVEAVMQDKEVARLQLKTANVETTNALLWQTNISLRKDLVSLQLKVQPRFITSEQVTNFVFLTERIRKIPLTVSLGQAGFDTDSFASQFRKMLSQAGFGTNEGAGTLGIARDSAKSLARGSTAPPGGDDIIFVVPSTEIYERLRAGKLRCEIVNGITRPVMLSTNQEEIYYALTFALEKVRISYEMMVPDWNPKEFEFFVPLKNQ